MSESQEQKSAAYTATVPVKHPMLAMMGMLIGGFNVNWRICGNVK